MSKKNDYEAYMAERMKSPKFRAAYEKARAKLKAKKPRKETEEAMKEARRKPVKMRTVGWGVRLQGEIVDGLLEVTKAGAQREAKELGGKPVRLYVRSDK